MHAELVDRVTEVVAFETPPRAAADAVQRGLAAAGDDAASVTQQALAGGVVAVTAYANGDVGAAVATAEQVGALVDGMSDRELSRQLRSVVWLGMIDLLLGRYQQVAHRQTRAVELARTTGQLHVLPALLVAQGAALRWLGRLDEANGSFAEAAETARSTGAAHLGLRLPPRQAHPGARAAGASTLDVLSAREREVAGLVTDGRTNRDIASALFLSVKTVERHLGRIFIKLDISSRAALAALVAAEAATLAA